MRIILGLGNPGQEYEDTRHNAGFLLADHLAARWGLGAFKRGDHARELQGRVNGEVVRLVKPQTYMNRSGAVLGPWKGRADFDPTADLLVLVDDIALAPGRFRLRGAGSPGGHNGLKSIQGVLGRQDYARLRIGVGAKPPEWEDLADWVLSRFGRDDRAALEAIMDPMAEAVETWIGEGIERAMTKHNKGPERG